MELHLRQHKVRGKTAWVISRTEGGKRRRTHCKTKQAAETEMARMKSDIRDYGAIFASLNNGERYELVDLYSKCKKRGISLREAMEKILNSTDDPTVKLSTVITELLETKEKAGRSSAYVKGLKSILNQFASGREANPVASVGLTEVEAFLHSKDLASRPTLRSRLSTLFKFAIRRGYRLDNPCARLEPITVTKPQPAIFTPKQFQTCLQWLRKHRPKALPWFILTTCCGLRPEEAEKTCKADIHSKEGWIKVEAQTTKVRQRRVVYPKPEAMALLKKSLRNGKLPIGNTAVDRAISGARWKTKKHGIQTRPGLRSALGWQSWPRDITRHTAASYWLADCESTAAVARYLGHSESVLLRHYAATVTKKQAQEFWRLVKTL